MNKTNVIFLGILSVAATVCSAIIAFDYSSNDANANIQPVRFLPHLDNKIADISSITVSDKSGSIALVKRNNSWIIPEKGDFPAKTENISNLLTSLAAATLTEEKTSKQEKHRFLGLDNHEKGNRFVVIGRDGKEISNLQSKNPSLKSGSYIIDEEQLNASKNDYLAAANNKNLDKKELSLAAIAAADHLEYSYIEPQREWSGSHIKMLDVDNKTIADIIVGRFNIKRGTYIRQTGDMQSWLTPTKIITTSHINNWVDSRITSVEEGIFKTVRYNSEYTIEFTPENIFRVQAPSGYKIKSERAAYNQFRLLQELSLENIYGTEKDQYMPDADQRIYTTAAGSTLQLKCVELNSGKGLLQVKIEITANEDENIKRQLKDIETRTAGRIFEIADHLVGKFNNGLKNIAKPLMPDSEDTQ
ncbi:MAG: DUF4340 domain-containing protein [Gammaproteobacteria bacterium]|nr:MAG: DUF4340 domain-containing protein [Gammaproteobacteria bacterium]